LLWFRAGHSLMGILKLTTFELRPYELLFGVVLILTLALVMIMIGLLVGSGRSPWSPGSAAAQGARTETKSYGGWAIGLFFAGALGSLLLMALFPQQEQPAVVLGGVALILALVLG